MGCATPEPRPSVPGVRIAVDTTFYEATGVTPREWLASSRRGAASAGVPLPWLAQTRGATRWTYTPNSSTYGVHEQGHAARNVRSAIELRDSLQHAHTPTCATFGTRVTAATQLVLAKYRLLQASYDDRTQHGARQGAMIIPARGARLAIDTTYRDTVP